MFKKIMFMFVILLAVMCVLVMPNDVKASSLGGKCGDNVYWAIEDWALIISGEGEMYDFSDENSPWYEEKHFINEVIIEEGVEHIGNNAFERCYFIKEVSLPKTLKSIGDSSFEHCRELLEINFPDSNSIEIIGEGAFEACYSIEQIEVPDSVKYIGNKAFSECTSLSKVDLSNNITVISDSLFDDCISLTGIIVPEGVTSIGDSAFAACTSLKSVNLPNGLMNIGDNAFIMCEELSSIDIPVTVTSIGEYCFKFCDSLTSVFIPKNVTKINNYAFNSCASLTLINVDPNNKFYKSDNKGVLYNKDMTTLIVCPEAFDESTYCIPEGVITIEGNAFYSCDSLVNINIPNTVRSIGDCAFEECSSLMSVNIPYGVTKIGNCMFRFCSSLTDIILPESITIIGDNAFYGCYDLSKIVVPENVTTIGWIAFRGQENLSIYFKGDAPEILEQAFYVKNVKAYYPKRNSTWTTDIMQNYGSLNIEWFEYDPLIPYSDVSDNQWYYEVVKEAYNLGLMTGATDTLFKPTANMNRGMVAIVFHRMEGSEYVGYSNIFTDVSNNQYYTTAVMWAKQKGIISGYNSGLFKPLNNVTREEMATMIYRFAQYKGKNVSSSKDISYFNDYNKISSYAKKPLQWSVENGIMSGKDNGERLDPTGTATRAECAKMLVQAYKLIYAK